MKRLLAVLALLWLVGPVPTHAQNTTCATRPYPDSTNACASTAFVSNNFLATILLGTGVLNALEHNIGSVGGLPIIATTPVNGNCLVYNSQGAIANVTCTPAGSGTVGAGTIGQLAGYISNGTSVVGLDQCLNIEAFGGVGNGSTDNITPWASVISALGTGGGCIYFPTGKWNFSTSIAATLSTGPYAVHIKGDGQGSTILYWPNAAGGLTINYPGNGNTGGTATFSIQDLTMTTGQAGGGTALKLSNVNSIGFYASEHNIVQNVSFRGDDGIGATDYWSVNFLSISVSNLSLNNIVVDGTNGATGVGVQVQGNSTAATNTNAGTATSSSIIHFASNPAGLVTGMFFYDLTHPAAGAGSQYVSSIAAGAVTLNGNVPSAVSSGDSIVFLNAQIVTNINNIDCTNIQNCVVLGTGAQGLEIGDGSNFTGCFNGVVVPINALGLVQLIVNNSQFNCTNFDAVLNSSVAGFLWQGNTVFTSNTGEPAILLNSVNGFAITGNFFAGPGSGNGYAVDVVAGGTNGGVLSGNVFSNFNTAITLGSSAHAMNVQSNVYTNTVTQVVNSGGTACPPSPSGNCLGGGSQ